jgi:hypothetical protein
MRVNSLTSTCSAKGSMAEVAAGCSFAARYAPRH